MYVYVCICILYIHVYIFVCICIHMLICMNIYTHMGGDHCRCEVADHKQKYAYIITGELVDHNTNICTHIYV